jgi:transcription elongation factor Elf1
MSLNLEKSMVRCVCGGRVSNPQRHEKRSVYIMHCLSCGTEYGYPLDHPFFAKLEQALKEKQEILLAPGFTTANNPIQSPPKLYNCKRCGDFVSKEQALKTFHIIGKALCAECQEAV